MRNHNNFRQNLAFAQKGELESINLYLKKYPNAKLLKELNDNKNFDFLIENDSKEIPIEVKEDVRVKDTGNVLIEFESRGKPSGISTSKSEQWVFRLHSNTGVDSFLFNTADIKLAIKNKKYTQIRQMYHTDSKNKLYFFKKQELLKIPHVDLNS